ncbi:MAG: dicarboxylate/amino acid:cation symporter [Parachlamydiaceae bacterium]
MNPFRNLSLNSTFIIAIALGVLFGFINYVPVNQFSYAVSEVFIRLLKLVSLPIIALSLLSTASGMEDVREFKWIGFRVLRYTLLTTFLAASIALGLYLWIEPVQVDLAGMAAEAIQIDKNSYFDYLLKAIPSNIVKPFVDNHVIGVMMIAMLMSVSMLTLPKEQRMHLHTVFHALFACVMKITGWIVRAMPVAVFAFIVLFFKDLRSGMDLTTIALYLLTVISANLVQGAIVLPILLKVKGIAPFAFFRQMLPALTVAFFSKSSSASIPAVIKCAVERAHLSSKIANFSLPLCTTINMNGCAAFILTTVLFVSMSSGMEWSLIEMMGWVVIATLAAVGNAGVPMGCYFLSGAILAALNVPLEILGVILPFYTIIDMVETALNVWSDASVTAIVEKEVKEREIAEA